MYDHTHPPRTRDSTGQIPRKKGQCFETRPGPAVEPINPVIQKKSGLDFVKNPIFRNYKNPKKFTKTWNPIPVEPLGVFIGVSLLGGDQQQRGLPIGPGNISSDEEITILDNISYVLGHNQTKNTTE
ncbi:hypothetical protein YC2023_065546 [Brassica napus]